MIDDNNFRKIVLDMMYHPEAYSKEDYYEACLEMTGRYLNEMVTTINLENALTENMAEKEIEELLFNIQQGNPDTDELDAANAAVRDMPRTIENLLSYLAGIEGGCADTGFDAYGDEGFNTPGDDDDLAR